MDEHVSPGIWIFSNIFIPTSARCSTAVPFSQNAVKPQDHIVEPKRSQTDCPDLGEAEWLSLFFLVACSNRSRLHILVNIFSIKQVR